MAPWCFSAWLEYCALCRSMLGYIFCSNVRPGEAGLIRTSSVVFCVLSAMFSAPNPVGPRPKPLEPDHGRVSDRRRGRPGLSTLACEALDSAESLRQQIQRDGEVIATRMGIRDHPALKHELANRSFVSKTSVRIGLDVEPVAASAAAPRPRYRVDLERVKVSGTKRTPIGRPPRPIISERAVKLFKQGIARYTMAATATPPRCAGSASPSTASSASSRGTMTCSTSTSTRRSPSGCKLIRY